MTLRGVVSALVVVVAVTVLAAAVDLLPCRRLRRRG